MDAIELKTPEDLVRTINQIRTELMGISDVNKRLDAAEKAGKEIAETLQGLRLGQQEAAQVARTRLNESDAAIERAYFVGDTAPERGGAVSRGFGGVTYDRAPLLGSKSSGIIRLLGSLDSVTRDYTPGLIDDPNPRSDWQRVLQTRANDLSLWRAYNADAPAPMLTARLFAHAAKGPEKIARVFADNSGEGADFIPDIVLPEVFTLLRTPASLASKFQRVASPTGGTTSNPFVTGGCQPFIMGQPTAGDMNPAAMVRSIPGTASVTVSPTTLGVALPAWMDMTEESVIEWGSFASSQVANGLGDGEEDALLNGDTAATHQDTIAAWAGPNSRWGTLGMTNDHRKAWIGLRARAFDVSAAADKSASETAVGVMGWRAGLTGAYRGSPSDLFYVLPLGFLIAKILIDTNFLTMDKAGPLATLFTGAVGMIGGIPVYSSDFMTEDLNASGVFDNSTLDYTSGLLVNHRRFRFSERYGMRLEVERAPLNHTVTTIAKIRESFRTVDQSTTKNVYCGYKLSKA